MNPKPATRGRRRDGDDGTRDACAPRSSAFFRLRAFATILPVMPVVVSVLTGCASDKLKTVQIAPGSYSLRTAEAANPTNRMIVTPGKGEIGTVVRVNDTARFAVLNFPLDPLPPAEKKLNVYRRGLKVGEVRVTGPQQDDNTVADIITGEIQVGDSLRAD